MLPECQGTRHRPGPAAVARRPTISAPAMLLSTPDGDTRAFRLYRSAGLRRPGPQLPLPGRRTDRSRCSVPASRSPAGRDRSRGQTPAARRRHQVGQHLAGRLGAVERDEVHARARPRRAAAGPAAIACSMPSARTAFGSSATASNRARERAGNGAPDSCSERSMVPIVRDRHEPGDDRHVAAGRRRPGRAAAGSRRRRRTSG